MSERAVLEWVTAAAVAVAVLFGGGRAHAQANASAGVTAAATTGGATLRVAAPQAAVMTGALPACAYGAGYGARCAGAASAFRWGVTGTAVALLGTAVVFHVLAVNRGVELDYQYNILDPNRTRSVGSFAQLQGLAAEQQTMRDAAIGFYIGGGLLALGATLLWIVPRMAHCGGSCPRRATPAPPVAFDVGPGSLRLAVTF